MAYIRVRDFIAPSLYPLKAPYGMSPEYITIHNTANDATARNEIAYMKRNKAQTSYHVAIDEREAIEAIPFNRSAWHCGDANGAGNRKSIGIEICYSKSGGAKYAQAEANAIEYTAQLLKEYGWTIDNVRWHRDWSGKNCPHRIFDEGRAPAVRKAIADRLAELTKVTSASVTKPNVEGEESEMLILNSAEKKRMAEIFANARKSGTFSSDEHEKSVMDGTMTKSKAIYLIGIIANSK